MNSSDNKPLKLSVCVDILDELIERSFNEEELAALFRCFQSWGMSRIYWIYTHNHANGYLLGAPWAHIAENYLKTYENIGELLPAAVRIAHALGLELYAVYKPFDVATNNTFPFGSASAARHGIGIRSLSGDVYFGCRDLAPLADMRFARRWDDIPSDLDNRKIGTIRLVSATTEKTRITQDTLSLVVSDNNGSYRPYEGDYGFIDTVEDGRRVITLNGLRIPQSYLALLTPFMDEEGTFRNRLAELVELFDTEGRPLPFTYGLYSRSDRFDQDLAFDQPKLREDYPMEGYDFNVPSSHIASKDHPGHVILDNLKGYIALAKGKERYVVGALSPAYSEVQDYWLGHIRECLEAGVDGVDLRVENHNRALFWEEYGYEQPVIDEYRRLYGKGIPVADFDREKQVDIIARHYSEFYRKASGLIRQNGRRVQIHIGTGTIGRLRGLKWEWDKWINEGFADEITLKEAAPGGSALLDMVYPLSAEKNVPLHVCPYLCDASKEEAWWRAFSNQLNRSAAEGRENGFILYESAYFVRVEDGGGIHVKLPHAESAFREFSQTNS